MKSNALKVFLYYYRRELLFLFIGTKKCQHNGLFDSHLLLGLGQGLGHFGPSHFDPGLRSLILPKKLEWSQNIVR